MPKIPKGFKYIGGLVSLRTSDEWDDICSTREIRPFDRRDLFGAAILYFIELVRTDTPAAVRKAQDYLLLKKDPNGIPGAARNSIDEQQEFGELLGQKVIEAISAINWSELMASSKK